MLSQVGNQVAQVALLLMVYRMHASTSEVAGLVFCETVPAVFFGLYSGAIIDRFPKKPLLIGADLFRAAIMAALPFVSALWAIYLLAFLTATASTVFIPARQSVIPELVEEEKRVQANSFSGLTFGIMLLIGPAIGGALVGFWSVTAAFLFDAFTFLWSAAFISRIAMSHAASAERSSFRSLTKDVGIGMRYIRTHDVIAFIFMLLFVGNLSLGFWFPVLPSFNHDYLHGNSVTFGLLTSAFGLGSLIGAGLSPMLARRFRKGLIFYWTIFLEAVAFVVISFSPSIGFALGCLVVWGVVIGVWLVAYETMMQSIVEPEYRGRVFSMSAIQFNAGMLLAQFIVFNIAGVLPPQTILLCGGSFYLAVVLLAVAHKRFRTLIQTT